MLPRVPRNEPCPVPVRVSLSGNRGRAIPGARVPYGPNPRPARSARRHAVPLPGRGTERLRSRRVLAVDDRPSLTRGVCGRSDRAAGPPLRTSSTPAPTRETASGGVPGLRDARPRAAGPAATTHRRSPSAEADRAPRSVWPAGDVHEGRCPGDGREHGAPRDHAALEPHEPGRSDAGRPDGVDGRG